MTSSAATRTAGIPKSVRIHSAEIRDAVQEPIQQIVGAVRRALEITPPELAADIEEFRAEELEHRDTARSAGATNAVGYPLLTATIRAGCRVAIELSKRI